MKFFSTLSTATMAAMAMLVASCAKEQVSQTGDDTQNVVIAKLDNAEAQKGFAKILSKAVSNSEAVRAFLRTEALAQFDNDYDVFYPFVKNKIVADGKTFRDILLDYCESETELVQIEESLLLLNILVPDFTLFWEFDAEKWDTADSNVAVISRDDTDNTLYADGEPIESLPSNEIPGFPCLVVKNNERMCVSNGTTRAANATYKFIDNAYDSSKTEMHTRKARKSIYYDLDLEDVPETTPYAKKDELDHLVIEAWDSFHTLDDRQYQRDFVYYKGLDIKNPQAQGILRENVQEELFMFRISKGLLNRMSDAEGDSHYNSYVSDLYREENLSKEQLLDRIWKIDDVWKDGSFEIVFRTFVSYRGGNMTELTPRRVPVLGRELYAIDKANVQFVHKTWAKPRDHRYSIPTDAIYAKWVRPGKNTGLPEAGAFYMPYWDLDQTSMVRYLAIYEEDPSVEEDVESSWKNEYAKKVNLEGGINIGTGKVSGNIKVGYEYKNTTTEHKTIKYKVKRDSDPIGENAFYYRDPLVIGTDKAGDQIRYQLYSVSAGGAEVVFVPRRK